MWGPGKGESNTYLCEYSVCVLIYLIFVISPFSQIYLHVVACGHLLTKSEQESQVDKSEQES
jgi:hypothetical protein